MTPQSLSISRALLDMGGITAITRIALDRLARPLSRRARQELPALLTPRVDLLLLQRLDPQPVPRLGRRLARRHQGLRIADLGLLSRRPAAHPVTEDLSDRLVRVLRVQASEEVPAMAAASAPDVKSTRTQAKEMAAAREAIDRQMRDFLVRQMLKQAPINGPALLLSPEGE